MKKLLAATAAVASLAFVSSAQAATVVVNRHFDEMESGAQSQDFTIDVSSYLVGQRITGAVITLEAYSGGEFRYEGSESSSRWELAEDGIWTRYETRVNTSRDSREDRLQVSYGADQIGAGGTIYGETEWDYTSTSLECDEYNYDDGSCDRYVRYVENTIYADKGYFGWFDFGLTTTDAMLAALNEGSLTLSLASQGDRIGWGGVSLRLTTEEAKTPGGGGGGGAGAVPEPATWALMIGGFGLAGATLRRRRAQAAI